MKYVLQTKELKKNYKDFQALNGLSMNVPKGSIYGFVGKNGAGKTILFRQDCRVLSLQEENQESFFMNLIGGRKS